MMFQLAKLMKGDVFPSPFHIINNIIFHFIIYYQGFS